MLPLVKPYIAPRDEMLPAIEEILYSGYIAEGDAVKQFEKQFADFIENPYTISLNSGTAALHISLLLIGVGPGDEVISTALTAEPTNTAIAVTGAKVVWADVEEDTGLISPASIRQKITERTKAIMVVHYAGMLCDMDAINTISKEYKIPVIEDTAHALGGQYRGKPVGSNSPYTCFSFQAIKQMTTVDGGALSFGTEVVEQMPVAKQLRWFGLRKDVPRLEADITKVGYKYNMNNVNATIGLVQLQHICQVVNRHVDNGRFYDKALQDVPGVQLLRYSDNTIPSYWLYTMKVENRADFIRCLEAGGITASPLHHRSDTHSVFASSKALLPGLDRFYQQFVHIPCGWWVDDEDRQKVVDCIKQGW